MPPAEPVLHLAAALPPEDGALPNVPLDLRLMPGECALIETLDPERGTALAELCSGMAALRRGEARFMGYDWAGLDRERAAALRGRIGRIHGRGAWIDMLGYRLFKVLGSGMIVLIAVNAPALRVASDLTWLTLIICAAWLVAVYALAQEQQRTLVAVRA